jgi:hypothetical protein
MFRNNLLDIERDPWLYGCHSCRRGGAQWLAREKEWNIPRICDWGGWALDFNHATILKYLYSWNDDPQEAREGLSQLRAVTLTSSVTRPHLASRSHRNMSYSRPEIKHNPPRWQPNPDPTSIHVPGLDTAAPVLDQVEQIEQLITIKLQVCRSVAFV